MGMDVKIEDKRWIKPKHWRLIVPVFVIIMGALYSLFSEPVSIIKVELEKLSVDQVFEDNFHDYISVLGTVEPITSIYLDAIEGGRVDEILIEEGAMMKKGDVILRLYNQDLKLNIMNSESSLAYHTNELRNTLIQMEQQKIQNKRELLRLDYDILRLTRNHRQNKALFMESLISEEEYLLTKEDFELAIKNRELAFSKMTQDSIFRANQKDQMDDNLASMQMNLKMVRQRLENLNVKSPVDGQLGLLNAELGEAINKGQRIGQVNILNWFKVNAKIDEHFIDKVRSGLNASFERQNETFGLKVKKTYPEVREGQFEVDMNFVGTLPDNIRIGQTYNIKLELGQPEKAVLIPRGGFFQVTGGQWIYVLEPGGQFADKRSIKIGRQNPQYYEVLSGLESGEKVITSSYSTFGNNDRIIFKEKK
ncbi:efflux RND transporter periplasmic adaptor subunit [Mangrovibacterium sp.]|uniref:efflux RND transporter periplasmic adaptor subunit n=1 Tax=Mangrovibacterium sp. TaxID=1961364 RepID=UPI0035663438